MFVSFFFFNDTATTEIYTLSLHDALPISTTLWENRAALHHAHLTEGLIQGQGVFGVTLQGLQAAGLSQAQALAQINRLIDQQAYTRAADDIFLASSVLFQIGRASCRERV